MHNLPIDAGRRSLLRAAGGLGTYAGLAGLGALAGCGGDGGGEVPEPIASSLLTTTPENQAATFRNVDRIGYATRPIRRGSAGASPMPASSRSLAQLQYIHNGSARRIEDFVANNRIAGLLVLKNGAVAYEQYAMGNTPRSRWTSFSVAKSLTSTLLGAAVNDGSITSLDDPVTRYVPALRGSAYQDNTIRQLLYMCSGVRWVEEYDASGNSDIVRLSQALASGRPGAMMELMRTRERAAPPGSVFNYSTGESYVLGAVVAGATGSNLCDYLSRKIWVPFGMETDGYWVLDAPDGLEMGGNNFSATLRDYARIGQFFMTDGQPGMGRVLPMGWRNEAGRPGPVTGYGKLDQGPPYEDYALGYGYQWWALPPGTGGAPAGNPTFSAIGIFGQYIYINPDENVVVAMWSAWSEADDPVTEAEFFSVMDSAIVALR